MNRERVVLFLDYANINRAAQDKGIELDYHDLLEYMGEGRFLVDAHIYVPIDPRNEHRLDRLIEHLWEDGYVVRSKVGSIAGNTYKCDFDVEITMEVLSTVYQVRPDIIVLATGDSDFVPLLLEVRRLGVRVEVASFEDAASRGLKLRSSGFISLDAYTREVMSGEEQARAASAAIANADDEEGEPAQSDTDNDTSVVDDAMRMGTERPARQAGTPNIPHADDY